MKVERGLLDRIGKSKKNVVNAAKLLASDPSARTKGVLNASTPVFTEDRDYLRNMITRVWEGDETVAKKAESERGNV